MTRVGPDNQLEPEKGSDGFILQPQPRRMDLSLIGFLQDKIGPNHEPFDIEKFRNEPYNPLLRY